MTINAYRYRVVFQDPGPAVPDGVGGYSQSWTDLPPGSWMVDIAPTASHDLERIAGGNAIATTGLHLIRGRFHAGVTTKTRMIYDDPLIGRRRTFAITGTRPADLRSTVMELSAVEMVAPS